MPTHALRAIPALLLLATGCTPTAGEVGSVDDTEGNSGSGGDTSAESDNPPATTSDEEETSSGLEPMGSTGQPSTTDTPTTSPMTTTGPSPVCGNDELEGEEICDDGNLENEDGCNADCVEGGAVIWDSIFPNANVAVLAFGPDDTLWTLSSFGDGLVVADISPSGELGESSNLELLELPDDAGLPATTVALAPTAEGTFASEARFWSQGETPAQGSRISWIGDPPWTVDRAEFVEFLAVRPGGGVVFAAADATVQALDATGASLWTWNGTSIEDLEAGPAGILVVERSVVTLLDADGVEQWSTPDPASDGRLFLHASARTGGGFDIFAAAQNPVPASPAWLYVDATGAIVQDIDIPNINTTTVDFSPGGRIVWSQQGEPGAQIFKAHTDLETAWSVDFNNSGAEIAVGSDGRVAAVGLIGGDDTLQLLAP